MKKGEQIIEKIRGKNDLVLDNLESLFILELNDLYDSETQIIDAMPMMISTANSNALRRELERHFQQTKTQRDKLTKIFESMNVMPSPKTCKGMKGILQEGEEMMKKDAAANVKDAALIASAQKVEHYEMASYGTVLAYAKLLNEKEAERLLKEILNEEKNANDILNELAVKDLNIKAVEGEGAM